MKNLRLSISDENYNRFVHEVLPKSEGLFRNMIWEERNYPYFTMIGEMPEDFEDYDDVDENFAIDGLNEYTVSLKEVLEPAGIVYTIELYDIIPDDYWKTFKRNYPNL